MKSTVDNYIQTSIEDNDDDGDLAPCCHLLLRWIGGHGSQATLLNHKVMILGTTEHDSSFTILHEPSASNRSNPNRHLLVRKNNHNNNYLILLHIFPV